MKKKTPCSDYQETRGLVFFVRMLDKIRLNASGKLAAGYNLGFSEPTGFDARFCRFWEVDYEKIFELTSDLRLPSPIPYSSLYPTPLRETDSGNCAANR
ncbi:MAG TPA: DUF5069 domain-containing protein [Opitutaceae bacterium]|nr:DUF5069 domain-containing protein [Opitutaceae bacterium]